MRFYESLVLIPRMREKTYTSKAVKENCQIYSNKKHNFSLRIAKVGKNKKIFDHYHWEASQLVIIVLVYVKYTKTTDGRTLMRKHAQRPRTAAQPLTSKISTYVCALKLRDKKIILLKSLPNGLVI